MNAASEVLARLSAAGITLALGGDQLLAQPASSLTDAHRNLIRANKGDLLRLLTERRRLWTITEPSGAAWVSSFTPAQTQAQVLDRYPGATVEPADGPAPPETDPLPALYRRWLSGITEPTVLLTLDDDQVRAAIAAGVVSRDTARASVLLLYRSPPGDLGPGAAGLIAVPKERYRGFSPADAIQALSAIH